MKRKLNLLLIPITIAVFGIVYFQVDWMVKTYKAEINKLENGSGYALAFALSKFKSEQKTADSAYIAHNLKKWVDTIKMNYTISSDSLHIDLEYVHPPLPHPTMKTGYYMHVSLSSPAGISIMSPSILSTGKTDPAVTTANQKNMRLDDSLRKFFCLSPIVDDDKFFLQMEKMNKKQGFKSDSAKILKYFKEFLVKHKVTDPAKNPPVLAFVNNYRFQPKRVTVSFLAFEQNVFHRYPDKQIIAFYLSNNTPWVITKIAPRVGVAVLLVIIMIFAFAYLIKIIKQQKQLADIKDDFIDNLTHEFKTPIATISAAIEGMQKFKALDDKEKTARYLEISKNELTRLNDMVTKLLNISVYDKNNLKLTLHNVDMVSLIDDVVGMEQFRSVKPIKFTVHLEDAVKHIPADPLHFKNVLVNLIDNAVKYSKDSVEITITGTRDKNMANFTIRDNGIGIPSAELKHVFDKFYRVPTGDMHNIKGSGLGLSYVRSVIEAHGGTITANSEINVKTEFVISIPLNK
jgi:signal transduction histidine kinase